MFTKRESLYKYLANAQIISVIIWIFACAVYSVQIIFSDDNYNTFEKMLKLNELKENQVIPDRVVQKNLTRVRKIINSNELNNDKQTIYSAVSNLTPIRYRNTNQRMNKPEGSLDKAEIKLSKDSQKFQKLKFILPEKPKNKSKLSLPVTPKAGSLSKLKLNQYRTGSNELLVEQQTERTRGLRTPISKGDGSQPTISNFRGIQLNKLRKAKIKNRKSVQRQLNMSLLQTKRELNELGEACRSERHRSRSQSIHLQKGMLRMRKAQMLKNGIPLKEIILKPGYQNWEGQSSSRNKLE